jgi:hypothetical protein
MSRWKRCILLSAFGIALISGILISPLLATDLPKRVEEIEASWPDWLSKADACPADVMPAQSGDPPEFSTELCTAAVDQCLNRCRTGHAEDCYAAAIVVQKAKDGPLAQALFQKACSLGIVSGCTNRAAKEDSEQNNSCSIRTYELACNHDDPWACTMMGLHLVRGIGIEKDPTKARKMLSKSCRFGPDDQACRVGKALLKEIGG